MQQQSAPWMKTSSSTGGFEALHFNPQTQRFIGDDAANLLVNQPMRAPWASMI